MSEQSSLPVPVNIAVVEAEKTAVILSEHYPDCLWLASGGLEALRPELLFPLRGHRIILFPDTDETCTAYFRWYQVAHEASRLLGHPVYVSPLLEQRATPAQKRHKIDLVDFLFPPPLFARRFHPVCTLQTPRLQPPSIPSHRSHRSHR